MKPGLACTREATAAPGGLRSSRIYGWPPLPENGYAATFAGERKICTSATDNIIEVSTHPSGVGFERGILAVTHSIRKCYALIPELHRILHGKLIPFCTIVQSVPKNAPKAEIADALLTADTAGSIFKNR